MTYAPFSAAANIEVQNGWQNTNKLLRADISRVLCSRSNASVDLWHRCPVNMRSLSHGTTDSPRARITPLTVLIAIQLLLPAAALSQPVAYVTNSQSSTVSVLDLWTNKVTASIPVGRFPSALSTSRDGSVLYVGNKYSSTVSVIDGRTRQAVAEILVDGSPSDVAAAPDGAVAYVVLGGKGKIPIVSAATSSVIGNVTVASDSNNIRFSPDGAFVYVTHRYGGTLSIISTATHTVATTTIGVTPVDIVITPDGTTGYVVSEEPPLVSVVDLPAGTVRTAIPVAREPAAIAVAPSGAFVLVTHRAGSGSGSGVGLLSVIDATTNSVSATVPIPTASGALDVAISPDSSRAYVTSQDVNGVMVFDTLTPALTTTVFAGYAPLAIVIPPPSPDLATPTPTPPSPDGRRVYAYVTNNASANVSVIDVGAGVLTATVPVDNNPIGVAANPDAAEIYVTSAIGQLAVIDTASNAVAASIELSQSPLGVAVTPDGTQLYVTKGQTFAKSIIVIDTGCRVARLGIGVGGPTKAIAVHPNGRTAYAAASDKLIEIDIARQTVVATVPLNGGPSGPEGLALAPDGSLAFVTEWFVDQLTVIDTNARAVVAMIPLGNQPSGVAVTPNGQRAYVANRLSGTVSVIDTETRAVLASIAISDCPHALGCGITGVAVSPDGSVVYAANTNANNLSVIDTASNSVVDTIFSGGSPRNIAFAVVAAERPPTRPCVPTPTRTSSPSPFPTDTSKPASCLGDCHEDGVVTVDELVLAVNIALGTVRVDQCRAVDADGNERVSIDELVSAVTILFNGCPDTKHTSIAARTWSTD